MAVENEDQHAATGTEVETNDAGASSADQGVDLAMALAEALEREETEKALRLKAESDRDNYKAGLLKAKGKPADEKTGEDKQGADSPEIVSAIEKLLLRNKELETASAARSQISSGGQGASTETTMKVGDNMLSEDQVKELKARGKSDEWIARFKTNLQKTRF